MSGIIVAAGVGVVGSVVGGLISGKKAKDAAAAAAAEKARIGKQMAIFEAGRQEVINPFSDVKSLSGLVDEMRSDLSNPFASAGEATALAQAARASKKDVAANIEQQEAANEKAAAQGEQALQAKQMQLTQMEMSEEARIQNAQAQGKQFMFGAQENRDMATLDRMQAGIDQSNQNANMAGAQAQAGMISGITSSVGGLMSSGAFAEGGSLNPPG